jgi:amidohydrolase
MRIDDDIVQDMLRWRHDFHAHPETAFTEVRTSEVIATELAAMGIKVHRGLAKTGVVGTLSTGNGPAIALRCDIDALPITEETTVPYRSTHAGRMHACGHDGHTAMLMGAAKQLARSKNFRGTVHFIFQPAEENEGGGRVMIEEGLFDLFPCDAVYGMHNWPMAPMGTLAVNDGPMMAAFDVFEIKITGRGGHAAMPETFVDPFMPVAQILIALQTLPSRRLAATTPGVVSVTQVHGGDTWNVIPDTVVMCGTARSFGGADQDVIENGLKQIVASIAEAHSCTATVDYMRRYPATLNTPAEAQMAADAAKNLGLPIEVRRAIKPSMGSEDFGFMLQKRPGAYVFLGSGDDQHPWPLHNARYDFNDKVLPLGASYWCKLAEMATQAA